MQLTLYPNAVKFHSYNLQGAKINVISIQSSNTLNYRDTVWRLNHSVYFIGILIDGTVRSSTKHNYMEIMLELF